MLYRGKRPPGGGWGGARGCSKTSSVGNKFCLGSIWSFLHIVLGICLFFKKKIRYLLISKYFAYVFAYFCFHWFLQVNTSGWTFTVSVTVNLMTETTHEPFILFYYYYGCYTMHLIARNCKAHASAFAYCSVPFHI